METLRVELVLPSVNVEVYLPKRAPQPACAPGGGGAVHLRNDRESHLALPHSKVKDIA